MNKKIIKIMLVILFIATLFIILPSTVNAVSYTRTFSGNDGSITLDLTGLNLDESKTYSFALTTKGATPTTWHTLTEYTTTNAKILLSSATSDIVDVLKVADTGSIYIKEDSMAEENYVVNALQVNLKLPYLNSIPYSKKDRFFEILPRLYGSIGDASWYASGNVYYNIEKVTNKTFIEKFLANGKKKTTELESLLPKVPTSDYTVSHEVYYDLMTDGLYIVWVKLTGKDCKDVYGAIIYDGLPDATKVSQYITEAGPKVTKITVTSPDSGTYNTPQTVKINVWFNQKVKASTVPTLTIKFGNSQERKLTNGTIVNEGPYIQYTYNIQKGDNGQLATVSFTGGNVTDKSGNSAILTCPLISGNTIKANTEGIVTNNTNNKDVSNFSNTNNNSSNNNSSNNKGSTRSSSDSSKQADKTTYTSNKLPQTGVSYVVVIALVVTLAIGIVVFLRYRKMKDIN